MTFEKKFDALKKKFDKADTKKFNEDFAIQVVMTDEDCGGIFYIANIDGNYAVEPYDYVDRTANVIAKAADISKLADGVIAKTLVVEGNDKNIKDLAASLKKKAPAKKAPAKKAEVKPEVKKEAPKKEAPKKAEPKKATAVKVKEVKKTK